QAQRGKHPTEGDDPPRNTEVMAAAPGTVGKAEEQGPSDGDEQYCGNSGATHKHERDSYKKGAFQGIDEAHGANLFGLTDEADVAAGCGNNNQRDREQGIVDG